MNLERAQIVAAMERAGLGANQRSRFMAAAHILMRAGAEIKLEEAAQVVEGHWCLPGKDAARIAAEIRELAK